MSQAGKVALVTGAAMGIGRSFTEHLLAEGASVAVCDSNNPAGEATVKELSKKYGGMVIFLECDMTNDQQFEDCFRSTKETFSGIDIVINNAGIANETDQGWKRMIGINLVSTIHGNWMECLTPEWKGMTAVLIGTKLGFKYMDKNNGGRGGTIVNIASITGLEPSPSLPAYSATKAAVNQLSRSYGSDLYYRKHGVKVVAINPGMTKTSLTLNLTFSDDDIKKNFEGHFATLYYQDPDNLGKGLIEVLKKGQNGSLWLVENDAPPTLTIIR